MARTPPPAAAETSESTASHWSLQIQSLQLRAAREALAVFNSYVAALAAARDERALNAAQQAFVSDWMACVTATQAGVVELVRTLPSQFLEAFGWRLTGSARRQAGTASDAAHPDLVGQARSAMELVMRPWLPATALDHTDDVVA